MIEPPFIATMSTVPFGVLFVSNADVQLFTGNQWLKFRGKNASDDIAAGRTRLVDHFRFDPYQLPGHEQDELGRKVWRVGLRDIMAIHQYHADWVDERYLARIFDKHDVERIQDVMQLLAYAGQGKSIPAWLIEAMREL